MRCIYPLRAVRQQRGVRILKRNSPPETGEIPLPCGKCIECKLETTRQWAVRITHEQQMWHENYFLTLTYDKEHEPRDLQPDHFRLFMKTLRKTHPGVRYFMCGEYGEKLGRPHFHAAMFNLPIRDQQKWDNNLTTSKTLDKIWGRGSVKIGELNFTTASYVAAYCTKKITGPKAQEHYARIDRETGEAFSARPEYARMSLKPGLARTWIEKYGNDVFNYDHVIIKGREQKAPRFYDKILEALNPALLERHKAKRQDKAKATIGENTRERLKTREIVTKAKLRQGKRTYENSNT